MLNDPKFNWIIMVLFSKSPSGLLFKKIHVGLYGIVSMIFGGWIDFHGDGH